MIVQTIQHMDLGLVFPAYAAVVGLAELYAYCYIGKHSSDYYLAFGDCLYESNWMSLPNDMQKTFILMIAHSQIPIYYHGYGVVILDLNLFTRVITPST